MKPQHDSLYHRISNVFSYAMRGMSMMPPGKQRTRMLWYLSLAEGAYSSVLEEETMEELAGIVRVMPRKIVFAINDLDYVDL